jgi:hypothetical protein
LNPIPYFEMRVLDGPHSDLPILGGKSIIARHVPIGRRPPYVHSTGVIYVRVADKSDPIKESDRARLADLFERGKVSKIALETRLRRRPIGLAGVPHVQISIFIDPYDDRRWRHNLRFNQFAELMNPPQQLQTASKENATVHPTVWNLSLPFPYVQTVTGAFVARQLPERLQNPHEPRRPRAVF